MEPCERLELLKSHEVDAVFGGIIDLAKLSHSLYTKMYETVMPQLADGVSSFAHIFIEMVRCD